MRIRIILTGLLFLASCAFAASDIPKVSLDATDMPITEAMNNLAKQAGVDIVCEPDLKKTVTGQFQSIELDRLLDTITKTNQLKWQKIYLPTQDEQKPTIDQLKAQVSMLAGISAGKVAVYDPGTGKQKVFVEQDAGNPTVEPDKLGLKPIYFIYKPAAKTKASDKSADSKDAVERFQAIHEERMKLLAEMTPEQRIAAYQQEMMYMLQLSPEARQQLLYAEIRARHDMDPAIRDQYRDAMREAFRSMRDQGLLPEFDRGGPPFEGRGERGDRRDQRGRGRDDQAD